MNKKRICALAIAAGLLGALIWFSHQTPTEGLVPYKAARDNEFINKLFTNNWYWLIPDNSSFDVNDFLTRYTPGTKPLDDLTNDIQVYLVDGKPIGMIAYHLESFYKGRLRFIVVDEAFRGKGYSQKMLDHALGELKKLGATVVVLMTRTDNAPALKLYRNNGFCTYWQDEKYVMMEKDLMHSPEANRTCPAPAVAQSA